MEKKLSVFIEAVAFIDRGRFRSMCLDCVRQTGERFELWMDVSAYSSRAHLANWRHLRQMLKLYGIAIDDLAHVHFDEKAMWGKVVDKFYYLKLNVTPKGSISLVRVEGAAQPFKVQARNDAVNADYLLDNWEKLKEAAR